ncbi:MULTISPECIES: hypothetical protein [unclassified Clostridioides]|nr:hypothetical protein [Clostridioides difficile]MCC0630161.1 hypothetical protein [Clostridioides sp. ES-S-0171-01]MCC0689843.1 hypothetical protein [Clostridioides sp. ES-S-0056-01]MBY2559610.1 hypothetical protein [Clostridioides difficile]MCR1629051.1 hypothetical protein [Clostridioides difficile]
MFRYKGMMPSVFLKLKHGEKRIVKAFMYEEMEDRIEEIKHLGGGL